MSCFIIVVKIVKMINRVLVQRKTSRLNSSLLHGEKLYIYKLTQKLVSKRNNNAFTKDLL